MLTTYVLVLALTSNPDQMITTWDLDKRGNEITVQYKTLAECDAELKVRSEKMLKAYPNEQFLMGCVPYGMWLKRKQALAGREYI